MKTAKAITLILTLLPILAVAQQLESGTRVAATVPFNFVVGTRLVPAGNYIVQRADMNSKRLSLRNAASTVNLFSPNTFQSDAASGRCVLVFRKYGDRYFLAAVSTGDGVAYNIREGNLERELQAKNAPAREEILVGSLR